MNFSAIFVGFPLVIFQVRRISNATTRSHLLLESLLDIKDKSNIFKKVINNQQHEHK